jgi:uncharacterized protein
MSPEDPMQTATVPSTTASILFVAAVAIVLAVYNNVVQVIPRFETWYIPINVTTAALLLAAALAAGVGRRHLGLDGRTAPAGIAVGLGVTAVVAAGLAVAVAVPALRPYLDDARVVGLGVGGALFAALIRIPFGTVLLEEIAFRGVLLGAWSRVGGTVQGIVGSSIVFGIWHIRPTLEAARANGLATTPIQTALLVAAGVVVTAAAGAFFAVLRVRTGSLIAPILAHVATNSLGTLAVLVASRL